MSLAPTTELRAALHALAEAVADCRFEMPGPRWDGDRSTAAAVIADVDQHLVPRLANLDGPAVVVVLGSTGSGKSTIVNSLAQASITRPGAVRPTTRRPVAWTHRDNAEIVAGLGELLEVAASSDDFVRDLVVVDAPDFDSVVEEHREMVEDLIRQADYAVYVTTAQRYADSVPWEVLQAIVDRGVPLLPVINRLPVEAGEGDRSPVSDFGRLLTEAGIRGKEPIAIVEQVVDALHGALPAEAVAGIRDRLNDASARARQIVLESTAGAVGLATRRAETVLAGAEAHDEELDRLATVVAEAYGAQLEEFERRLRDGSMIRGEVIARWNEQLGASQLFSEIGAGLGRIRTWLRRVFGGAAPAVRAEAESELVEEIVRRSSTAARQVATGWDVDEAARQLVEESFFQAEPNTRYVAVEEIERWLDRLTALVRKRGEGRRRVAQIASYGVNAVAVLALVAVFTQTAGMTGAEVGITAGAAAVQQKLLEYVLGSAAARTLVVDARDALVAAVSRVFDADAARFDLARYRHAGSDTLAEAITAVRQASDGFYG